MRRIALTIVLASAVAATPALAENTGGPTLSVTIDDPADGAVVERTFTVSGTAAVGAGTPGKDTTLVYAVDVSGSVNDSSGVNCNGTPGNDSVLTCEKAAVNAVNTKAASTSSPVANSGVVRFNNTATALDVNPSVAGVQLLAAPGANITNVVNSLTAGGGTSFVAALNASNQALNDPQAKGVKILVFLSDGADTVGGTLPPLSAGTVVKAFAVGGNGCGNGGITLNAVVAKGAAGSSCTVVANLSDLDNVIGSAIGATVTSLNIAVDGGAPTTIPNSQIDPDLPSPGPVTYSLSIGPLALGPHEICVTATGSAPGSTATDCNDVEVVTDTVVCTPDPNTPCELTVNDGNVAVATFRGLGLNNKVVGMRPLDTAPGDCGGTGCVTGFDVIFDDTDGDGGVAELTVLTGKQFSTPPGQAAVFFNGELVVTRCDSGTTLPCQKINRTGTGQTEYFVRFAADPGITFR
jgi:hypothetical protein